MLTCLTFYTSASIKVVQQQKNPFESGYNFRKEILFVSVAFSARRIKKCVQVFVCFLFVFFFTLYLCKSRLLTFGKHSQYPLETSSTDVTDTQPHRQPLFKETISTLETLNVFLFLFCSLTYSMSLRIFILCPHPCIFLSTVSDFVCSCSD